ncbi:MAG: NAD(P)H-dependent oxidoreductase [Clostridia bacterium]|nr:NAD(P)H-dependent oxidoreductase [Clostridia bacterium]
MKKVVILNASPRHDGNSNHLADLFLSKCNCEIISYNMYDENIAPCIACNLCSKSGKCFSDDCKHIIDDIFSSDYIVFSTPIYCYSFPAPMKAFLDRLQPYYSDEKYKNPAFDRKGFVLASCGKSGKFGIDVIEKQSRIAFIELSASFEGIFLFSDTDKRSALTTDEICKVKQLAKDFFN